MSELTPKTKALLEEARRSLLPSDARITAIGIELERKLEGDQSRGTAFLTRRSLAMAVAALVLLVATTSGAAYLIIQSYSDRSRSELGARASQVRQEKVQESASDDLTPEPRASAPTASQDDFDDESLSIEDDDSRSPRTSRSAHRRDRSPQKALSGTLAEETRLITKAQGALRNKNPRGALRYLNEHRRSYPSGKLALDRNAAILVAQCQLGTSEALRTRAEQFVSRHPGSIYASRIRSECLR